MIGIDAVWQRHRTVEFLLTPAPSTVIAFFLTLTGAQRELIIANLEIKIVGVKSGGFRSNYDLVLLIIHVQSPAAAVLAPPSGQAAPAAEEVVEKSIEFGSQSCHRRSAAIVLHR